MLIQLLAPHPSILSFVLPKLPNTHIIGYESVGHPLQTALGAARVDLGAMVKLRWVVVADHR